MGVTAGARSVPPLAPVHATREISAIADKRIPQLSIAPRRCNFSAPAGRARGADDREPGVL